MSGLHDKDPGIKCQTKGDKSTLDRKFNGLMFDIDGVVKFQGKAYSGAVQLNEPHRGKPRGILKGKNHFIAASCGELYPIGFASLLDRLA